MTATNTVKSKPCGRRRCGQVWSVDSAKVATCTMLRMQGSSTHHHRRRNLSTKSGTNLHLKRSGSTCCWMFRISWPLELNHDSSVSHRKYCCSRVLILMIMGQLTKNRANIATLLTIRLSKQSGWRKVLVWVVLGQEEDGVRSLLG